MKYKLICLALLSTMFSCNKYDHSLYIRGRAFLTDTIVQNIVQAPAKNKKITLSENILDSNNYNYSVMTDSNGYFVFNLLHKRKKDIEKYKIGFGDSINSVYYSATTIVSGDENDITLNISTDFSKQNAIQISVLDSLGGPISGASVYMFSSQVLAAINDSTTAVQIFHSDIRGKVSKMNIQAGKYYLTAYKRASTFEFRRQAKEITIPSTGKLNDSLQLR